MSNTTLRRLESAIRINKEHGQHDSCFPMPFLDAQALKTYRFRALGDESGSQHLRRPGSASIKDRIRIISALDACKRVGLIKHQR